MTKTVPTLEDLHGKSVLELTAIFRAAVGVAASERHTPSERAIATRTVAIVRIGLTLALRR